MSIEISIKLEKIEYDILLLLESEQTKDMNYLMNKIRSNQINNYDDMAKLIKSMIENGFLHNYYLQVEDFLKLEDDIKRKKASSVLLRISDKAILLLKFIEELK